MNPRWRVCILASLVGVVCSLVFTAPRTAGSERYQVGVAKVDITPDYPIRLNGFGFRRDESTGVSQRIWAKALAISRASEPPLVLIAIDSLGVRASLIDEVARGLGERFGVPRQNVALTFSHSHCTPKVNGACDNIFSTPIPAPHQEHIDRYTRELTERVLEAATTAVRDRAPATLEWNVGQVGFAKNRRTPGGPVDHDLPLLVVRDETGKPRAVYVSYACHCVTLSFNQISGDWSGYAQESIERRFPNAVALVSIGCGSDSNPLSGVTGDKIEVAAQQGDEIGREVERLLAQPGRPIAGKLAGQLQWLDLPLNPVPTHSAWEELAKQASPAGYNAQTQLARLDRGEPLLSAIRYPVQSFTFGDALHMVFLAGEVCVDYSLRLKGELERDRVWINGYSNDFCAYIPSERLLREGGYGGGGEIPYFALPATFRTGLEQHIVDTVLQQTPDAFHAQKGTAGVPPKTPSESLACLQTHADLRVELVAAEPLVSDPVAIDFGPDGRLWVVEMSDYARGVNEDFAPGGRVRFLTDTDDDGQFDRSTEFLTGLRFPTDVKVWRDGVLVCDAPHILFAADTDGDGKADVRKTLFSGFATHNAHARVNSLRYGLDNWVYGSGGLFGGQITSAVGKTVDVTNRDFRFQPDGLVIEPVTGQTQQGRPRDDWDNWFGCTNGSLLLHYAVDDHYARRNPHIAPPRPVVSVPVSAKLFPPEDLVLFKLSGPPGVPTSACGAEIYRDELLGSEYAGNAFVCEPVNQLVHRMQLDRQGATFTGHRAANEADREFLVSTDHWFRPVQVRTGPDGALWIVDMYRYVIEHPQWIPPEVVAELNIFAGQGLGRIYRVVGRDRPPRRPPRLDQLSNDELAGALDSSNGVQRDLAQQLLVFRQGKSAVSELRRVLAVSRFPAARVQAASTLDGLGELQPDQVLPLLADPHPEVRRHGVRLSERFLDRSPDLLAACLRLVDDPAVEVRLQLGCSLGECRDERAAAALATLGLRSGKDDYLSAAVLSSIREENVVAILRAAQAGLPRSGSNAFTESLLSTAAAAGNPATVAGVIGELASGPDTTPSAWRWSTLARVLDAAERRRTEWTAVLTKELTRQLSAQFALARDVIRNPSVADSLRVAAIQLVARPAATSSLTSDPGADAALLEEMLAPQFSLAVQSAAVRGLARIATADAPRQLLNHWPDATPGLRAELLDTILARDQWLEDFLSALGSGVVKGGDLDATRRQWLLSHSNDRVRQRAAELLAVSLSGTRNELVTAWRDVLALDGDPHRGREAYQKRCGVCHQLDGSGFQVGPDLAALTNKSASSLLVAILDPNRDVDGRYQTYVAVLSDGRTISGLLVNESGNSVTLREQGGKDHVFLRTELEALRATGKSVMPEGLEKDVTRQDVADIMAYLLAPRIPPKRFAGNLPRVVEPDGRGELALPAAAAEIYGGEIAFESDSPFQNIGYWHGVEDYVGWQVRIPDAGRFDVYLDYSCAEASVGNRYRFDGAAAPIQGIVASTGDWASYRQVQIGTVELPPGRSYLTLRFDAAHGKKGVALLDLRTILLVPNGSKPAGLVAAVEEPADRMNVVEVARRLLDDTIPAEERRKLIADHPQRAAEILAAMVRDLPVDAQEEYRRIPWIWRVAIASGKRNQLEEIRGVLTVSVPMSGGKLRDWQAVVIGGGIINGITLAGDWPKPRIEAALRVDGVLVAQWQKAVEFAALMADDERIPTGTRYDALRMVAMGPWDLRGDQLRKYLAQGVHDELQMGAVSGTADVQHPQATEALLAGIGHYSAQNRNLALDGLLRTPDRCLALLDALADGRVQRSWLGQERERKLLEHTQRDVQGEAKSVLAP